MPNLATIEQSSGSDLVENVLGHAEAARIRALAAPMVPVGSHAPVNGIDALRFAEALNLVLFADLLDRVPEGAEYVAQCAAQGRRIVLDHGALRTVALPQGARCAMPNGVEAFRRVLEPLGYVEVGVYPLPRLKMTGHVWCHARFAETMPQFFVSELHVDQFSPAFSKAAVRVFGSALDRLDAATAQVLARFAAGGSVPQEDAAAALKVVMRLFDRQHPVPFERDYEILRAESAEAAWISTEGNAFNHVTDRVSDVEETAQGEREAGRSIKDKVEVSASGRVRQTALRAAQVKRSFRADDGTLTAQTVPGSFFEFITRRVDAATGKLDLTFDSGNATGIFKMTAAA
ncbi:DUF1338 domain-containing protein [Novosphingobium sp. SG720]|uniref:DUF1338 domain-containing protein n=1 Tax=Novosphingobium TaxID=165696 RepID=UPI0014461C53|nr:DUF1338 domain-containing protein [Novosphingobium sp. SG720]NKJ41078.1 hypothetical protein [Novosphingobium sp. SG720]